MVGSFVILEIYVYVRAEIVYCCVRCEIYLIYECSLLNRMSNFQFLEPIM
jgi:hypothetical protein